MKLYLASFIYMVRVTITNTIIQQKNTETGRNEKENRKAGN